MAQHSNKRRTAAVALGDREPRRAGGGWLTWLFPLLALLVIGALVLSLLLGRGDDSSTADSSTAAANAESSTLSAGGSPLRGNDPQTLTAAVGEQVTGTGVKVLSVTSGTGFWVGTSTNDRVFIEYGSTVGSDESHGYKPKVGDVVDLRGEVRPAPADPTQTLKLDARDSDRVKAQGAYINAQDVQAR